MSKRGKITRAIAALLCILLIGTTAACGAQKGGSTESTAGSTVSGSGTESTAVKADPFGKYDPMITISTVRSLDESIKFDANNPDRKSLTENVWHNAWKEELGIDVTYLWTVNGDQYDTKWNVSIASGDLPDMAQVGPTIYKTLLDGGLLSDLTDVYNNYASDYYKKINEMDNGLTIKYCTNGGKMVMLPQPGVQPDNTPLLFIRKDWLKKVNMPEPKTMDELINIARAFVKNKLGGSGTYGIAISKDMNGGQSDMLGLLNGYGAYGAWNCSASEAWVQDSTGKLGFGPVQPAMREALLKLQQFYKEGLFANDFALKDSGKITQDVAAGKVGIMYGVFWAPYGGMTESVKSKDAEWEVLPIPTVDGSEPKPQGSAAPGEYTFVNKNCKNPEAAVKLINLGLEKNNGDAETFAKFGIAPDGYGLWKYGFAINTGAPWKNLTAYQEISEALKTGDTSKFTSPANLDYYKNIKVALSGDKAQEPTNLVFGQKGTFSVIEQYKNNNQIMVNLYQSVPTETMNSSGTIGVNLTAAIFNVIMGADIKTYDAAVTDWKKMGGDTITQEVNDWYTKNKTAGK